MSNDAIESAFEMAVQRYRAGHLDEAESLCRHILAIQPQFADAVHLLGMSALDSGQKEEALGLVEEAISLDPRTAEYHASLGLIFSQQNEIAKAIAAYQRALTLKPNLPDIQHRLGEVYLLNNEIDAATEAFRRAVELQPKFVDALNSLGHILRRTGRLEEAIDEYNRVLAIRPNSYETLNNLGVSLKDLGRIREAAGFFRRALKLRRSAASVHSNLVYALHYDLNATRESLFKEHENWNREHALPLLSEVLPHENDRSPDRRLRIGYISAEFREHCQSLFIIPTFSRHDHRKFEIFIYSDVAIEDQRTALLKQYADHWQSTSGKEDAEVAKMIRNDRIDLLIDLTLHMANNRKLVFARKPAPVQLTWLGYPGTTGLETIDYRITDPYLDPIENADDVYSEESLRLPDTFWCYDPLSEPIEINSLPAQNRGFVTFGCLNNFCKVNDFVLGLWGKVMRKVCDSRLMLLAPQGLCRNQVVEKLGVSSSRIDFVNFSPRPLYLRRYLEIDMCLDTFPYNGHTTSLDALWMGVPVVSMCGQTAVSRAGFSQMSNLGLRDLVADSPDEFVQIAIALANDLPRLCELRSSLRDLMRVSPLMDAMKFTANLERIYRTAWRRYCANDNSGKSGGMFDNFVI
ncbi:MAG TPA: tetratricopeptide repeat protein [Tepidisphaeraceae bacterium]|nr:tetratricopeptide repeat protein [Tepidisphaeraceae bacterium]